MLMYICGTRSKKNPTHTNQVREDCWNYNNFFTWLLVRMIGRKSIWRLLFLEHSHFIFMSIKYRPNTDTDKQEDPWGREAYVSSQRCLGSSQSLAALNLGVGNEAHVKRQVEVWGMEGFVTRLSLGSECSLGQEHLEERRNGFDFKKADFRRMWYAPRNFYWNPMKHGKCRAEFFKTQRLKFKAILLNSEKEKGQLRPRAVE